MRHNAVVLLDGVTSSRPADRNGGWYADRLSAELGELLRGSAPLDELLAEAITRVSARNGLVPGDSPSSTVAIIRWTSDHIDALVLADSPIVAFGAQTQVLQDIRVANLPSLDEVAAWRNRAGGFWVAEANPAAAAEALTATWPRADVDAVVMATDGVSCGVDDYGLFTWEAVLAKSPQAVLDEVRKAELSDPDRTRWPRNKVHDDQALVVISGIDT